MLRISGYNAESFVDAEGVSFVIFFSGCKHYCKGCHSPQTHDFNFGKELDADLISKINDEIDKRPFLNALVLSGGDPMYSAKEILELLPKLHIPNDTVWCYTGFTFEELNENDGMIELARKCKVIVDGMFDINKRDITLPYRGSKNQRVIDVQQTIDSGRVICKYV